MQRDSDNVFEFPKSAQNRTRIALRRVQDAGHVLKEGVEAQKQLVEGLAPSLDTLADGLRNFDRSLEQSRQQCLKAVARNDDLQAMLDEIEAHGIPSEGRLREMQSKLRPPSASQ